MAPLGKEKALIETVVTEHFQLRDQILWTHNVEPRPHQLMHPRFKKKKKKKASDDTTETLPPQ